MEQHIVHQLLEKALTNSPKSAIPAANGGRPGTNFQRGSLAGILVGADGCRWGPFGKLAH
jgi:hypothetical protein